MRLLTGSFLALIAVAMAQPANENEQALRAVSESVSLFSNDFTQKVAAEQTGNLITSPLSANLVLAMAAYGARGTTQAQFQNVLRLPMPEAKALNGFQTLIQSLNNVEGVQLSVANKIFVNQDFPIKENYKALTTDVFHSTSESVNFKVPVQAANIINTWVKEQTHDRIDSIVDADSLDPSTALVLTNAVYFKGLWKYNFNPNNTKDLPFLINGVTPKNVPTMYRKLNTRYGELPELGAKILELPYKGEQMSMIIVLPNEPTGLAEVERKMQNINMDKLLMENTHNREVMVYLPKFRIETKLELEDTLKKMGLTNMFTSNADFSGIADAALYVSKVLQKAFIEVNEEGSEAAAVTAIQIMPYSLIIGEEFLVDRPFVYSIVRRSLDQDTHVLQVTPVFTGHVVEPSVQ